MANQDDSSASIIPQENQLPKGFICECGEYHKFGVYVVAHWQDRLTHTCDNCQRTHLVWQGKASLITANKKKGGDR